LYVRQKFTELRRELLRAIQVEEFRRRKTSEAAPHWLQVPRDERDARAALERLRAFADRYLHVDDELQAFGEHLDALTESVEWWAQWYGPRRGRGRMGLDRRLHALGEDWGLTPRQIAEFIHDQVCPHLSPTANALVLTEAPDRETRIDLLTDRLQKAAGPERGRKQTDDS
jgi:hypothetical protein